MRGMAVATMVMSRAHRKIDSIRATVIMMSGKAVGKSAVLIRDNSRLRSSALAPLFSSSMTSFSLSVGSALGSGVYGKGVGLDRSDDEVDTLGDESVPATIVGALLSEAISKILSRM